MTSATSTLVEYFIAEQGRLSDGALGLLAARAALAGHARWRARPAYSAWHARVMTKVVLVATAEELARIHASTETLALSPDGEEVPANAEPMLLVLPPQPKDVMIDLVGHLRLAPKERGPTPEPVAGPALVLAAAGDLGMHGGKLAAQCAHAALLANQSYGRHSGWGDWSSAGRPMALRRLNSGPLAELAARFPGGAVHDAGHTQVPAGALTVVPVPPWTSASERLIDDGEPW